jgi:YjbE family integral membrane protein
MEFASPGFWIALLQIIGVNIVLSGDNAVVIALAARTLPERQRRQAVLIGSGAAVVMRIVLTIVAVELLRLPFLKLIGAALLLYIGIQLLMPEHEEAGKEKSAGAGMIAAVRTILIADLVMSLDNVIAVAAAAKGSLSLLTIGLLVSIPLVIFGSTLLMHVMERYPIIVTIGAALLGWVAGEMAVTDPATLPWIDANAHWLHYALPAAGALIVVAAGKWLAARTEERADSARVLDLATTADEPSAQAEIGIGRPAVLFVVDDAANAERAGERFARLLERYREPVTVHLLSVQPPAHGDVSTFVGADSLQDYHHEEGAKALRPVRERLERSGVPYHSHIGVGDPEHVVAHYAKETGSEQIFFGGDMNSGSVEQTARRAGVPVTLVPG